MPVRFLLVLLASCAALILLTGPQELVPDRVGSAARLAPRPAIWTEVVAEEPPAQGGVVGGHSGDLSRAPASAARLKADSAGRLPTSGQVRLDALGNREIRMDNGVTVTTSKDVLGGSTTRFSNGITASTRTDALGGSTTHYSNGVTANSRKDALGNTDTAYSDGTRSTTRVDPFGNQVITYNDGRTETIHPDPFAPRSKDGKNERK